MKKDYSGLREGGGWFVIIEVLRTPICDNCPRDASKGPCADCAAATDWHQNEFAGPFHSDADAQNWAELYVAAEEVAVGAFLRDKIRYMVLCPTSPGETLQYAIHNNLCDGIMAYSKFYERLSAYWEECEFRVLDLWEYGDSADRSEWIDRSQPLDKLLYLYGVDYENIAAYIMANYKKHLPEVEEING